MKSKTAAGILALFLGGFGVHKFYLDRPGQGILYLLFCWTFIPAFIAFIEAIIYFAMSDVAFNAKYNAGQSLVSGQPQNIVVNVANSASTGNGDRATKLKELHDLRQAGALTEDEFQSEKQRLLAGNV
jgi:Predicted membrane protein